jgi:hypothetical protein
MLRRAVVNNLPDGLQESEIDSIFLVGSDAHGTRLADSMDVDLLALIKPNPRHLLGFSPFVVRTIRVVTETYIYDIQYVSLSKFIASLCKSSPGALEALFAPAHTVIQSGPAYRRLAADDRHVFMAQSIYHSYVHYAEAQLAAMEKDRPQGKNTVRKASLEHHGYDTKAAAHAIRALHMAKEFIQDGLLYVDREQRSDGILLRNIKRGMYSLNVVTSRALDLQQAARKCYDQNKDKYQEEPNRSAAEAILIDLSLGNLINYWYGIKVGEGMSSGTVAGGSEATQCYPLLGKSTDTEVSNSTDMGASEKSETLRVSRNSTNIARGNFDDIGVGKSDHVARGKNPPTQEGGENWATLPGVDAEHPKYGLYEGGLLLNH